MLFVAKSDECIGNKNTILEQKNIFVPSHNITIREHSQ